MEMDQAAATPALVRVCPARGQVCPALGEVEASGRERCKKERSGKHGHDRKVGGEKHAREKDTEE